MCLFTSWSIDPNKSICVDKDGVSIGIWSYVGMKIMKAKNVIQYKF